MRLNPNGKILDLKYIWFLIDNKLLFFYFMNETKKADINMS